MRLFLFILIFFVLEVTSIIKVGSELGAAGAIGLLVLDLVIGGVVFNFQSHRLRLALLRGQAAGAGPLNALSPYLAAFLFAFPGFFSDILALLLLFPPTRLLILAGVGQFLISRLGPRLQRMQSFRIYNFGSANPFEGFPGMGSAPGGTQARPESDFAGEEVIEGEFRDVTDLRDRDPGLEALPEDVNSSKRED